LVGIGVLVGAGVLIAGCTSASNSASMASNADMAAAATSAATSAGGGAGEATEPAAARPAAASGEPASPDTGSGANGGGGGKGLPALDNRKVIRTASLTLETHQASIIDPETGKSDVAADAAARAQAAHQLAEQVAAIGDAAGGYRGAVNAKGDTVVISLRVPVAEYEQVMTSLGELGLPTDLVEKASDVTAQVVDLDSRIKTMKQGVERVRALMADATKISEVIAIESELSSREADLEALLAEQAALSDQVALSTVTVTVKAVTDKPVAAPVAPPPAQRTGFLGGLDKGWAAAKSFAVRVAGVAGALLPWLPLIAVVLLGLWWIRRRSTTARRPVPGRAVDPPAAAAD
jgi:hypothetical protein